jgi:hypothetical protein
MRQMTWDLALGRWLAFCVHPVLAWRLRSPRVRAVVVTTYFTAGYIGVLTALLVR